MSNTLQHQTVYTVSLSDEERDSQTINEEHLGAALAALHRDGIVVLDNAVDTEHIDHLNNILTKEATEMANRPTTHFNNNSVDGRPTGNMSQGPPLQPDLMYDDIWANGPAAAVLQNVLGPRPRVNYVNGNNALPGFSGTRQAVHADLSFNHAQLPFGIVTNYYLVDTSAHNGSTEIWVASHRDTTFADHCNCDLTGRTEQARGDEPVKVKGDQALKEFKFGIHGHLQEKRRAYAPPIQPSIKRGSVVLRDIRLWHAGLPNPTAEPRIMLAFLHTPAWYQCPGKVVLPEATKPLIEKWASQQYPIQYNAYFVPADIDHKTVSFNPNFDSRNKGYRSLLPDLPSGFSFDSDDE